MRFAVGDDVLGCSYVNWTPLRDVVPLAYECTARCDARDCTSLASDTHHVRCSLLRRPERGAYMALCPDHGGRLKRDASEFMGVLEAERNPAYPVHPTARCAYNGCGGRPLAVWLSLTGLAARNTHILCDTHFPVVGVRPPWMRWTAPR